jgi:hypothetical protein
MRLRLAGDECGRYGDWFEQFARHESIKFDSVFRDQNWGCTMIDQRFYRGRCTGERCINAAIPPEVFGEWGNRKRFDILIESIRVDEILVDEVFMHVHSKDSADDRGIACFKG